MYEVNEDEYSGYFRTNEKYERIILNCVVGKDATEVLGLMVGVMGVSVDFFEVMKNKYEGRTKRVCVRIALFERKNKGMKYLIA